MGNKFLLFFTLVFSLYSENTFAVVAQVYTHKDATKTPSGKSCRVSFESLNYVGMDFQGPAICVDAKNDFEARVACASPAYRIINPGNPQYQDEIKGDIFNNPEGFYYCVPNHDKNNKQKACEVLAQKDPPEGSKYKKDMPDIKFEWVTKSKSDGDCLCTFNGSPGGFKCARQEPDKHPCEKIGLQRLSLEDYQKLPADKTCDSCEASCKCSGESDKIYFLSEAKKKCGEPAKPDEPPKPEPPKPAGGPDDALKACMDSWKGQALTCKSDAESAKKECDADKKSTDENKDAAKALDVANNTFLGANKNSGAQQECFAASLVTNGAKNLLLGVSDSCKSKIEKCTSACKQEDLDKIEKACQEKIGENQANKTYYEEKEKEIKSILDPAIKICGTDAKKGGSELSKLLDSVGAALKQSLTCMCQLSSSGGSDCNSIPTTNECLKNPSNPGCSVYGAVDVCTPGATFNAHLCNCQTNPKAAGCPGNISGGLSNFATGTQIRNGNGNSGNDPSLIAGGLKPSGDVNLSGGGDNGGASDLKYEGPPARPGESGGSGGPGGFGGLGGSGGGGANGPAAAVPPEDKGGLDGLFNKAKTFMSNAFKSSKPGSGNGNLKGSKDKDEQGNPNAYRPMRGIASRTGLGTKNQDIFIMMNKCFIAETCRNNDNGFLDPALKHK